MLDLGEPQFVNTEGFKWWAHKQLTAHAAKCLGPNWTTWIVESPEGVRQFVTFDPEARVAHESQQLDAVACWMDVQLAARTMK